MGLTDKQYNDIERYIGGEMEAGEKAAFEAAVRKDSELAEEVEAFREISFLVDSLERRLGEEIELPVQESSSSNNIMNVLNKEREYWEKHCEPELKRLNNQVGFGEFSVAREQQKGRVTGINQSKWLTAFSWGKIAAAAVLIGIIAVSATLYMQSKSDEPTGAVVQKPYNSTFPDTSSKKEVVSNSTNTPTNGTRDEQPTGPMSPPIASGQNNDRSKFQKLFEKNFVPDITPPEKTPLLDEGFAQYENGNYKEASKEYEEALAMLNNLKRGRSADEQEEKKISKVIYYAHYYNALSCLADGRTTEAISELKALGQSPDRYWQSKQQWYLALAYLKQGELQKSKVLLQKVSGNSKAGELRKKATNLHKELPQNVTNKFWGNVFDTTK